MPSDPALFGLSAETLFGAMNLAVLPAWALLVVAPRWQVTRWLVHSIVPAIILGLLYGTFVARGAFTGEAPDGANFGSLAGVMAFFTVPEAVLAGWAHYLVFDLFVGAWEVRDAERRGLSHWVVIPCLLLTLMLGPLGLLLYLLLRAAFRRGGLLLDPPAAGT